jgi:hypothetical protein
MKIFKVSHDSNNIHFLLPCEEEKHTLERHTFICEPRKHDWETIMYYNDSPKIKAKNFFYINPGCLCFDEHTLELCRTVFEMSGEILPLKVERGPDLYVLNILECMNGLDYENTVWDYYDDGTKGRILDYSFHGRRVINESSIFKIPETAKVHIFCLADYKAREDEFYHIYHDNNLTGLKFEEMKFK